MNSQEKKDGWFDWGNVNSLKVVYFLIFAFLYFIVWIPSPYIFPWKQYLPGFFGIPAFIWVWALIQIITGIVLYTLYSLPAARALYEEEGEEENK